MSSLSLDRKAASGVLMRMESEGGGRLDQWMRQASARLESTDRRRVHAVVYGIQRHKGELALYLAPFLGRPLDQQDPEVRVALLIGSFELLFQDSVPDRAAVHQAVELIKFLKMPRRSGLINAVLRRVARGEEEPTFPDRATSPLGWAEQAASHPSWLVSMMAARVGPSEAADWAEAANAEPTLAIRLKDADDTEVIEALGAVASPFVPGAWLVPERPPGPFAELPGFADGRWWVQDVAAQAVGGMLGLEPGMRVLDACAAPGGKTAAAALEVGPSGRVVAVDRPGKRLELLSGSMQRLGFDHVEIVGRDLLSEPWEGDTFDAVLLDAPCSGLGVIRRHPEIRWTRLRQDTLKQGARQRSLLDSVLPAVNPGGALIYSVCTFAPAETDKVVEAFTAAHPEWSLADPRALSRPPHEDLLDGSALRTYPHRHDADAFFGVRLER